MNNIVNIVNFIRAIEPRAGYGELDLFEPVREQMAMAKRLKLPTTWLLQYDALTQGPFVEFLKQEMPENHEIGIWFETVQPNVEAAGIEWRGRWAWDWHTDVGFSVGYTPQERERIADVFVAKFAEIFGRKPTVMGSWLFDAHLLDYLRRVHGLRTACNCKDQYGTDGYTLWGGYWANAYYPSRRNSYLPAQHESEQIPVPVFRMLGSDPLYQYTAGVGGNGQSVITLEPVYEGIGGGSKPWIDWFLRENFREPHFAMAYAQAGQENSFGWPRMQPGLPYQYERLAQLRDEGAIRVETLGESGEWFRRNFRITPVSAVITQEDWKEENHAGVWYLSRFGRLNIFRTEKRELVIRDWQLFDENCEEPFLNAVCRTPACTYDALPVMDGMLWHPAVIALPGGSGGFGAVEQLDDETMRIEWKRDGGGSVLITLKPETVQLEFPCEAEALEFRFDPVAAERHRTSVELKSGQLEFCHNRRSYRLLTEAGAIERTSGGYRLAAAGKVLKLRTEVDA